jgi:uncharacterized protein YjbI with pentapeptide repeats
MRADRLTVALTAAVALCSVSAFRDNPQDDYTWVAKLLNFVGIRTYADLREVDVAVRPDDWDGKDWSKVKGVDLRGRNLAFADATRAFLANADLRGANLTGAALALAELQGAIFYDRDRDRPAQLQGAGLRYARLQGADLSWAQLQGANLGGAQLQGAGLSWAELQGADLRETQLQGADLDLGVLQGADLGKAQLQGANLGWAVLQGADLSWAQLQGADLRVAQLQGADLRGAQFQGASLRETTIWRAQVEDAQWDLADLRGSTVQPMADSDVDALISEVSKGISDEGTRTATADLLTESLRGEERSPRPQFPDEWRSKPNVMFSAGHPEFEPFRWGQPSWVTEEAYETALATFLGDLACAADVPEAQTRGLAQRAINNSDRLFAWRLATRLIGPDCPPAKGLPEGMRRRLEELTAQAAAAAAPPEAATPDRAE